MVSVLLGVGRLPVVRPVRGRQAACGQCPVRGRQAACGQCPVRGRQAACGQAS